MRRVVILGSTGSIGLSTLSVLAQHSQRFEVLALTAASQVDKLLEQCLQFKPRYAAMLDAKAAAELSFQLKQAGSATEVLSGHASLCQLAAHPDADIVMAAIVGAAGLLPTLAAVEQGKTVLLANKEALVMSGELFINKVKQHGATLLPIDSEHSAIFQSLPEDASTWAQRVEKIILTASGGPFRTREPGGLRDEGERGARCDLLVASRDEAANAITQEALGEAAGRAARDEALLRAFDASGKTVEAFADMYGMPAQEARRTLERARARQKPRDA